MMMAPFFFTESSGLGDQKGVMLSFLTLILFPFTWAIADLFLFGSLLNSGSGFFPTFESL